MFLVSSCSWLRSIHWSQVLSWEWRCSWSSADRRCSNYIWVINNFIAYYGSTYIRGFTVVGLWLALILCAIFSGNCWLFILSNLWLYSACWAHFMCHHDVTQIYYPSSHYPETATNTHVKTLRMKSPGDLLFLVRFRCRRCSAKTFQLYGKTPEAIFFKPHMVDLWVWENFLAPISVTLGQGH